MPKTDVFHALKRTRGRAFFAAVLALFFCFSAHAASVPDGADNTATRIELQVIGAAEPPKEMSDEERREALKAGLNPALEMPRKAAMDAVARAVKLSGDLSTQYPKCHFRLATLAVPEERYDVEHQAPLGVVKLRVTLLGDAGCLSQMK